MSEITLYCPETPELKLGPGTPSSWAGKPAHMTDQGLIPATPDREAGVDVIVFARGYATFDTDQFPDWRTWVDHPGTPTIQIFEDDAGVGLSGQGFVCEFCGVSFKADLGLQSHRRAHVRRGDQVPVPTA